MEINWETVQSLEGEKIGCCRIQVVYSQSWVLHLNYNNYKLPFEKLQPHRATREACKPFAIVPIRAPKSPPIESTSTTCQTKVLTSEHWKIGLPRWVVYDILSSSTRFDGLMKPILKFHFKKKHQVMCESTISVFPILRLNTWFAISQPNQIWWQSLGFPSYGRFLPRNCHALSLAKKHATKRSAFPTSVFPMKNGRWNLKKPTQTNQAPRVQSNGFSPTGSYNQQNILPTTNLP